MKECTKRFFANVVARIIVSINRLMPRTKDIVIVWAHHIGDFVLFMDSVRQLREHYPDNKITLICTKTIYTIASESKLFDETIVVPESFRYFSLKCIGMRAKIVICPCSYLKFVEIMVASMIAAEEKIVTCSKLSKVLKPNERAIFTQLIDTTGEKIHETERYQQIINQLFNTSRKPQLADLRCYISPRESIDTRYFIINLGASTLLKRWPTGRFAETAEFIANKTGKLCVLIGGTGEESLARNFSDNYSKEFVNLVGKTSIKEMITCINYADMVICNDTSTLHIAAACQVKCFCIAPLCFSAHYVGYPDYLFDSLEFCPTIIHSVHDCEGCWLPAYEGNHNCNVGELIRNRQPLLCISDISVKQVTGVIESWLNDRIQ